MFVCIFCLSTIYFNCNCTFTFPSNTSSLWNLIHKNFRKPLNKIAKYFFYTKFITYLIKHFFLKLFNKKYLCSKILQLFPFSNTSFTFASASIFFLIQKKKKQDEVQTTVAPNVLNKIVVVIKYNHTNNFNRYFD